VATEKAKIKESKLVDDINEITLTSDQYAVTVVPKLGAKITSIYNRKTKREFLSRTNVDYRLREYGDKFENYERDGADECFPTVGGCPYPNYPWQGTDIPDHGELWCLPWEHEITKDKLRTWVRGVRLPYLFERTISFESLARHEKQYIKLSYSVSNDGPYDMPFLYAFHPLFKAETKSKLLLPPGADVVTSSSSEDRLGKPMTKHEWPQVTDFSLDKSYDRSVIRSSRAKESEKLFTTPLDQGRCAMVYPKDEFIGFLFPAKRFPHLGLWVNEGDWYNQHQVALEPSTSQVDRLDVAVGLDTCGVVPAGGTTEWDLSILIGKGEEELNSVFGEF
jgi:galactose mutarotase-like enzyme